MEGILFKSVEYGRIISTLVYTETILVFFFNIYYIRRMLYFSGTVIEIYVQLGET